MEKFSRIPATPRNPPPKSKNPLPLFFYAPCYCMNRRSSPAHFTQTEERMAVWKKKGDAQGARTEKASSVDLSDVIKGMQKAVNEAQKMLEMHSLKSIRNFFHEDGEPKTIELHLAGDDYLEVPVLALASHSSLMIDRLSMEFEAKIEQVGVRDAEDLLRAVTRDGSIEEDSAQEQTAVFGIGFSGEPNGNVIKVKMEFAAAKQPEGLSRILDEYNKLVVPYRVAEGVDNSPWKDGNGRGGKGGN